MTVKTPARSIPLALTLAALFSCKTASALSAGDSDMAAIQQQKGAALNVKSTAASRPATAAAAKQALATRAAAVHAEGGDLQPVPAPPHAPLAATNAVLTDSTQPNYIGSCTVVTETGQFCLQDGARKTLFFCSGQASRSSCSPSGYSQTCTQTIVSAPSATGKPSLAPAQTLVFYLSSATAASVKCDAGSLTTL